MYSCIYLSILPHHPYIKSYSLGISDTVSRHIALGTQGSGDGEPLTTPHARGCCPCVLQLSATPTTACCCLLARARQSDADTQGTRKMEMDTCTSACAALMSARAIVPAVDPRCSIRLTSLRIIHSSKEAIFRRRFRTLYPFFLVLVKNIKKE